MMLLWRMEVSYWICIYFGFCFFIYARMCSQNRSVEEKQGREEVEEEEEKRYLEDCPQEDQEAGKERRWPGTRRRRRI